MNATNDSTGGAEGGPRPLRGQVRSATSTDIGDGYRKRSRAS